MRRARQAAEALCSRAAEEQVAAEGTAVGSDAGAMGVSAAKAGSPSGVLSAGRDRVAVRHGLAVPPRLGRALVFYHELPNRTVDHLAWHNGCFVRSGGDTRWALQKFKEATGPVPRPGRNQHPGRLVEGAGGTARWVSPWEDPGDLPASFHELMSWHLAAEAGVA